MLVKDKLIIVFYVNVDGLDISDRLSYLSEVQEQVRSFEDESTISWIIPTTDGKNKLECINPVLLNEEQYKEVEEKLDYIRSKYNELI